MCFIPAGLVQPSPLALGLRQSVLSRSLRLRPGSCNFQGRSQVALGQFSSWDAASAGSLRWTGEGAGSSHVCL